MKKNILFAAACCAFITGFSQIDQLKRNSDLGRQKLADAAPVRDIDPVMLVNTFVGTGGHGHTFPGAVTPFGMVQLSPDTRKEGWDGCGGYHYSDSLLYGFSHTHLSGTGISDYADLLVTPYVGDKKTALRHLLHEERIPFSHKNEKAAPGYYSVSLENPDVQVRLTASPRCGMQEYRFGQSKGKKFLLLNLGYRDMVLDGSIKQVNSNIIEGSRISKAWADHQHFYFHLETSAPFTVSAQKFDAKSKQYYMILEFPESIEIITVKTGVSGSDIAGAKANLQAEIPGWDFNAVMQATQQAWRNELNGIKISGGTKESMMNFYTALYHAYVHPSLWSDADGRYRDFNNEIQVADGSDYSVFSLWDTYRAANPLYTITQPKKVVDFVESYYQQSVNTGLLPMWTLSNNETDCMIGYHAASIVADAMVKHLNLKHTSELLDAMVRTSTADIYGRKPYGEQGFISADQNAESVSKTLEYAYDDWCISQYASQLMGQKAIAAEYQLRSMNWRNLYYPESGFFQPRQGGIFLPNFKPNEVNHHYTEANAWQYSLAAPHDIRRLIDLKGGNKDMEDFLDSLFHGSSEMSGREQADITGLIGQYAQGNEPSHHMVYVYNYCGAAYKAQELLDRILKTEYRNAPDGLAGNEDCGQMSAWFVMSSMGFYPFAPGSPTYTIGRPLFNDVRIRQGNKDFHIEVVNNSENNKYVQLIQWNGKPWKKLYITHDMIVEGGDLQIVMGPQPKAEVNEYETDLPESELPETALLAAGKAELLVPVPYFSSSTTAFADSLTVGIEKLPTETGRIVYALNAVPDEQSTEFTHNLELYETTTIYARIYRKYDGREIGGPVVHYTFRKFDNSKSITLTPPPANQYSGSNPSALTDGMFGGPDYRSVGWQGFEGQNVVAEIALQQSMQLSKVLVHALQDTKSWIFFPKGMVVEYSTDGKTWKKAGKVLNKTVPDKKEGTVLGDLELDFSPVEAKYVRVTVENYGSCPSWHLGAGGKTWIFLDEITVR